MPQLNDPICKIMLVSVRTPAQRTMKIRAKAKEGPYAVVGAELRNVEKSIDQVIALPCTAEVRAGWLSIDLTFEPADYVFNGTFWDIFVLLESEGEVHAVRISSKKGYRVRSQATNKQCLMPDGMIVFPRFTKGGYLALTHRKLSATDTLACRFKEIAALAVYAALLPYWRRRRMWLMYEKYCSLAQDNAFHLFEYCMNEKGDEARRFVYFVIDKSAPDYANVARYGANVIDFMSFRHMLYTMVAKIYVASDSRSHLYQWRPKPNVVRGRMAKHKIFFLQHGVTAMKRVDRIYGVNGSSPVTYFLATSKREQDIVVEHFGYPPEKAPVLGFSRWDVLEDRADAASPSILVMPTWRSWLEEQSDEVFLASRYFEAYSSLLASPALRDVLERHGAKVRFFIHPKLSGYLAHFVKDNTHVEFVAADERPLNELIMECSLLVTDYSSVCWDALFLEKPVVFYQFDRREYDDDIGGYVDFDTELPGASCADEASCIAAIDAYASRGFAMTAEDVERAAPFLPLRDRNNRQRTYDFLVGEGF